MEVLLAGLLRQVLALLLRIALVMRLRAAPHVAVGHRAAMLLSRVIERILVQTARCLLHLRRALAAASHLIISSVTHGTVTRIGMRIGNLLCNVGSSVIPRWIIFVVLVVRIVQVGLAVQILIAVLHSRRRLLHLARRQLLQVSDARLEPLHALLLATVRARYLLLMNIVIITVICIVRLRPS